MLESMATERCICHQKGPESDQIWHRQDEWHQIWHRQDEWPETTQKANPITVNHTTASYMAEQVSLVPSP